MRQLETLMEMGEISVGAAITRDEWWKHEKELQELRKEMELKDEMREDYESRIERLRSKYWRWIAILVSACGIELGVILTLLFAKP